MNSKKYVENKDKPKLLVLTSGYQRWKNDKQYDEDFVVVLTQKLSQKFDISLISPKVLHSKPYEIINNVKIYRHKQFISDKISMAYGSGIIPNISKNIFLSCVIPFYVLFQFLLLFKTAKREKVNLILAHYLIPQGLTAILYKIIFNQKCKILVIAHGSDINSLDNNLFNTLRSIILRHVDSISAVSYPIRSKILKLGYKKRVFVYPMGVNTGVFAPKNYKTKKRKIILFVGSIIEKKGIRYLLNSMPAIIKKHPSVKLLIAGNGNLMEEMKTLTTNLKIEKRVKFLGHIEHAKLPYYFSTARVFVLPSFSEGFPLVVSEALSSGVLTVTSDIPVFKDFSQKNPDTIFITKLKNTTDIANKISTLLDRNDYYRDHLTKQRTYAVNNLDWNIVANNYSSALNSLQ